MRDRHARQGLNTGEGRQHATGDPGALMPGYISYYGALMPDIADALVEDRHGTLIAIEVTAGAKTNSFPAGYNAWRKTIGCRVTAPAVEGKANHAIIILISEKLSVPATAVSILSGATSSQKKILVTGIHKKNLLSRLQDIA
jgi:hypothetical protein